MSNTLPSSCEDTPEWIIPSDECKTRVENDKCLPQNKCNQYELHARRNWDKFYLRNSANFFKDRHWSREELSGLFGKYLENEDIHVLEVGCGVGNLAFPILENFPSIKVSCCDFSKRAVQFVVDRRDRESISHHRLHAFESDLTQPDCFTDDVAPTSADLCTAVFVLSAVSPTKMTTVLQNIAVVLKSGGRVFLRDYGMYDHAMLRFRSGHKLAERFYVRQDGTRAFYFSLSDIRSLAEAAGLTVETLQYLDRRTTNVKEQINVQRVFVQAILRKP